MTVPVVGSLARKPPWRYLPEIHASRLSISGSMRPKLGLFILCILLFLSVVALLVPLLTKFYSAKSNSGSVIVSSKSSVLSEYIRHVWPHTQPDLLLFSPAGMARLVTVLSRLVGEDQGGNNINQGETDTGGASLSEESVTSGTEQGVNHTVSFQIANRKMYEDLRQRVNRSDSVHVRLVNLHLVQEKEMASGHITVITSHQIKLAFQNMKLTEERYYMSPGVSKRIVMYDLVATVDTYRLEGETVYRLTDLNNLTLTLVIPRLKGASPEYIVKSVDKYLDFENRKPKRRSVRIRFPIINAEKVTQLGPVIKHLHGLGSSAAAAAAGEFGPAAAAAAVAAGLSRPAGLQAPPAVPRESGSVSLLTSILKQKADISHLASLQIVKGQDTRTRGQRVQETVVFDHKFVFVVTSKHSQLPLIVGVFDIRD